MEALARPGEAPEVPFTAAGTAASHQPCLRLQEKHQEDPKRERRANREEDGTTRVSAAAPLLGFRPRMAGRSNQQDFNTPTEGGLTAPQTSGRAGEELIKKLPRRSTRNEGLRFLPTGCSRPVERRFNWFS